MPEESEKSIDGHNLIKEIFLASKIKFK